VRFCQQKSGLLALFAGTSLPVSPCLMPVSALFSKALTPTGIFLTNAGREDFSEAIQDIANNKLVIWARRRYSWICHA